MAQSHADKIVSISRAQTKPACAPAGAISTDDPLSLFLPENRDDVAVAPATWEPRVRQPLPTSWNVVVTAALTLLVVSLGVIAIEFRLL